MQKNKKLVHFFNMELGKIADQFEARLKDCLPGSEAHLRMAPSDRIHGTYPSEPNDETSTGAVLILLYLKQKSIYTLLIQRPDYQGVHSNQISFPGGKSEAGDKTIYETAIREAEEEVGIPGNKIKVCGSLSPLFIPVSNIEVFPVVSVLFQKPEFIPDPNEVRFIIEAEIQELHDPLIIKWKNKEISGHVVKIPYYDLRDHQIWGATAMIISEFLELYTEVIAKSS